MITVEKEMAATAHRTTGRRFETSQRGLWAWIEHSAGPAYGRAEPEWNEDEEAVEASAGKVRDGARMPSKWLIVRVMLILLLSGMPILGISADVLGLLPQRTTAVVIIVLATALATVVTFSPHRIDMIVGRGLIAGMVACALYDGFRLFAVHAMGWMGDFIPVMGAWVTGEPNTTGSAVVGYVWRYAGDGGGLGVTFFVFAMVFGLDRWGKHPIRIVLTAVGYAVFVWSGLIATVVLAPRGEELMFCVTPATFTITLIGHLIFGLFLGMAFVKAQCGTGEGLPGLLGNRGRERMPA